MTARGFVFPLLEDGFGLVNVIVKPPLYERQRNTARAEPFIIVTGVVQIPMSY